MKGYYNPLDRKFTKHKDLVRCECSEIFLVNAPFRVTEDMKDLEFERNPSAHICTFPDPMTDKTIKDVISNSSFLAWEWNLVFVIVGNMSLLEESDWSLIVTRLKRTDEHSRLVALCNADEGQDVPVWIRKRCIDGYSKIFMFARY